MLVVIRHTPRGNYRYMHPGVADDLIGTYVPILLDGRRIDGVEGYAKVLDCYPTEDMRSLIMQLDVPEVWKKMLTGGESNFSLLC